MYYVFYASRKAPLKRLVEACWMLKTNGRSATNGGWAIFAERNMEKTGKLQNLRVRPNMWLHLKKYGCENITYYVM